MNKYARDVLENFSFHINCDNVICCQQKSIQEEIVLYMSEQIIPEY